MQSNIIFANQTYFLASMFYKREGWSKISRYKKKATVNSGCLSLEAIIWYLEWKLFSCSHALNNFFLFKLKTKKILCMSLKVTMFLNCGQTIHTGWAPLAYKEKLIIFCNYLNRATLVVFLGRIKAFASYWRCHLVLSTSLILASCQLFYHKTNAKRKQVKVDKCCYTCQCFRFPYQLPP